MNQSDGQHGGSRQRFARFDLIAFIGSFALGLVLYLVLGWAEVPQSVITGAVVAVMLAYALLSATLPRLKVRLDQAGDNSYYLGLLFTLISMAFALYEFGQAGDKEVSGAEQIISNFGTALATTIFGILLRVLLHQMRIDPAEVESVTRLELADAASKVNATLRDLSRDLAFLVNEMRQRTSDELNNLVTEAGRTVREFTVKATDATRDVVESSANAHTAALNQLASVTRNIGEAATEIKAVADRVKLIELPPSEFAASLNAATLKMQNLGIAAEGAGTGLKATADDAADISRALRTAATEIEKQMKQAMADQEISLRALGASQQHVTDALQGVGDSLEEDRKRLHELEEQTIKSMAAAGEAQSSAGLVLENLVTFTKRLTAMVEQFGSRG